MDKWIDFHTHRLPDDPSVIAVYNVFHDRPLPGYPFVSVGIHPWHVRQWEPEKENDFIRKARQALAIGEAGLDKAPRHKETYSLQKEIFKFQIHVANRLQKPMIIHCVRCYDDLLSYRKIARTPWIIHGFNKSPDLARQLIRQPDIFLSFGHAVLRPGSNAARSLAALDWEHIVLETDEAPVSINEIYLAAAKIKDTSVAEIRRKMAERFENIFQKSVF